MKEESTFDTTVCGIPCGVVVDDYLYQAPFRGSPMLCDSDLDYYGYEEIDWHLVDRKGYRAEWLEKKMDDKETELIEEEIREHFISEKEDY